MGSVVIEGIPRVWVGEAAEYPVLLRRGQWPRILPNVRVKGGGCYP